MQHSPFFAALSLALVACANDPSAEISTDADLAAHDASADVDASSALSDGSTGWVLEPGFYQVVEHRLDSEGCGTPTDTVSDGDPFFEVYIDPSIGPGFLFLHSCEALVDCSGGGSHFFIGQFLRPQGADLYQGTTYGSVASTQCRLVAFDADVTPEGADGLKLDLRRREIELDLPQSQCTGAEAQARADDMQCIQRRAVKGVPVN
jgi:hypothetical protein